MKHGTRSAYVNYRCRCAPCKLAESRYSSSRRSKANNVNQRLKAKIVEILNDLAVLTH